ncbi:MAG: hypothetical protein IPM54_10530 [Polyangiaceae bacterium]|nr:hypothetical protein [Polyangiaceae bacterium]
MARPSRAEAPSTRIIGFRLTEEEESRLDELVVQFGHKDRSALLRSWLAQRAPDPNAIRFTEDEERRLDELVAEQGHADRTALLRSWLDQRKPNLEAILTRCASEAAALFSFVLDEAKRREYRISWNAYGFRVNDKNIAWSMSCSEPNFIWIDFIDAESIRNNELATGLWDWYGADGLRLSITESNVNRVRERIARIFDSRIAKTPQNKQTDDMRHVYEALRAKQDARNGLIYVPSVVRAVEDLVPLERVHTLLRELDERGVLELRPNAGRKPLPDEDAALCPPGPRKTVFAYARWKGDGFVKRNG